MLKKRIGILGGSGEIGRGCVEILLKKGFDVVASYRTKKPKGSISNIYVQLDINNLEELHIFIQKCDVIINCAGASFVNGEKISRAATERHVMVVDPSGESFLEERIKDIEKENTFVLSSGCFPGMTGVLLKHLCRQFENIQSISGMSISTEIPSQAAIEDFILTNIAGFGQPLKCYVNGEYVRNEQIVFEMVNNSEFKLQNYYTVELEKIVKKFSPEKANWYNVLFAEEIMKKMQEAVILFGANGYDNAFKNVVTEIKEIFSNNISGDEKFNFLKVEANGIKNGDVVYKKAEILNESSSKISAIIASYTAIELLSKKLNPGIYYAMDVVDENCIFNDLPDLGINLQISENLQEKVGFNDDFEEGII